MSNNNSENETSTKIDKIKAIAGIVGILTSAIPATKVLDIILPSFIFDGSDLAGLIGYAACMVSALFSIIYIVLKVDTATANWPISYLYIMLFALHSLPTLHYLCLSLISLMRYGT